MANEYTDIAARNLSGFRVFVNSFEASRLSTQDSTDFPDINGASGSEIFLAGVAGQSRQAVGPRIAMKLVKILQSGTQIQWRRTIYSPYIVDLRPSVTVVTTYYTEFGMLDWPFARDRAEHGALVTKRAISGNAPAEQEVANGNDGHTRCSGGVYGNFVKRFNQIFRPTLVPSLTGSPEWAVFL